MVCVAIQVYTLKSAIVETSVEEYLEYKEDLKRMIMNVYETHSEAEAKKLKKEKERRTVFVATVAEAEKALKLAGISYKGEINLEEIEFCKVEALHECMYGNLDIPKLRDVLGEKYKMSFFVNRKNIVIIDDSGFATKIIQRIIKSKVAPGQSRERFLYSFCVQFMERDLAHLQRYVKIIMKIEEQLFEENLDGVMESIAKLRKELLILREYYDELRDFGKQLEENENHFFSGKNIEYFGIISDRADRLMNRTMYLLDYVAQVRESYQGIVAEQQNDNMKFLTVISTIFFPLTLITGWYGMNFQNMPELTKGYPFVIALSIIVVCVIYAICKKKDIF